MPGRRNNVWYLDSGCSRHVTGDYSLLSKFEKRVDPSVTFGDDNKSYTLDMASSPKKKCHHW